MKNKFYITTLMPTILFFIFGAFSVVYAQLEAVSTMDAGDVSIFVFMVGFITTSQYIISAFWGSVFIFIYGLILYLIYIFKNKIKKIDDNQKKRQGKTFMLGGITFFVLIILISFVIAYYVKYGG